MKQNMDAMFDALKKRVEKVVGRSMVTPRDFDYLAMRLFDANRVCISSTTLKRFWGYLDGGTPRRQTHSLCCRSSLAMVAGSSSANIRAWEV